jgi:NTE family protein
VGALNPWRRGRRPGRATNPIPPREVVVLSGGGSLGAAQVGALQALVEAGIVPDAVVGCSVGSINAVYVATDPSLDRLTALEAVWRSMSRRAVFPDGRFAIARRLVARDNHLYTASGLRRILADSLTIDDLSETAIPCHVVTTDLLSGEPVWWTTGDPLEVLSASACIPGLFPPVKLGDRLHVDGGVSCPVPTQHALGLGAARVWVLDVARTYAGWADERMSALDVLLECFAISRSHLGRQQPTPRAGQRVVALPALSLGRHDMRDFSRTSWLIRAGREAGRAMVRAERQPRPRRLIDPAGAGSS